MEYIEGGIRLLEETYYSFCSVGYRRLRIMLSGELV